MKIKSNNFIYVLIFSLVLFLSGCKEKVTPEVLKDLEETSYVSEVKKSLSKEKPVVIGFFADWCPHCQKYKPIFSDAKEMLEDQITFIQINVDDAEAKGLSSKVKVNGVPTTAFITSKGEVFDVRSGGLSKEKLISISESLRTAKSVEKSSDEVNKESEESQESVE